MAEAAKGGWSRVAITVLARVRPNASPSGTVWLSSGVMAASMSALARATPNNWLAGPSPCATLFLPVSNVPQR